MRVTIYWMYLSRNGIFYSIPSSLNPLIEFERIIVYLIVYDLFLCRPHSREITSDHF